jgi:hypothetical protein
VSKQEIMRKYGLKSVTNIHRLQENREKYMNAYIQNKTTNKRKRLRDGKYKIIEDDIRSQFEEAREVNIPINGNLMQQLAKTSAIKKGIFSFKASNGWLQKFKNRESLKASIISGESNSVDQTLTEDWVETKLLLLIKNYRPEDIFNGDEFGLLYKMPPKRSLNQKGKHCKGGKLSRERISVWICANMDGSEKEKLVVIGKYAKPRCFKNVKSLPVIYENNNSSWMTNKIFTKILHKLNKRMADQGRHVLLFVNNCSAHTVTNDYSNIKIIFLPPNTTSRLQPMDQEGTYDSFKTIYRNKLVIKLLDQLKSAKNK